MGNSGESIQTFMEGLWFERLLMHMGCGKRNHYCYPVGKYIQTFGDPADYSRDKNRRVSFNGEEARFFRGVMNGVAPS